MARFDLMDPLNQKARWSLGAGYLTRPWYPAKVEVSKGCVSVFRVSVITGLREKPT